MGSARAVEFLGGIGEGAERGRIVMLRLDFIKGHCGWDTVSLLLAEQVPAVRQRKVALQMMDEPCGGGLEVGFLSRGEAPGTIRLRMVDSTTRDWISMCGGMTQVVGKALVETWMREYFDIDVRGDLTVTLATDSGAIPLRAEIVAGKVGAITTVMDDYAKHLYGLGVRSLQLLGITALDVGEFLVLDIAALNAVHPGIDFTRRDAGPHLDIVNELLEAYRQLHGRLAAEGVCGMLYDRAPDGGGDYRVFPRFFGGDGSAARIPYEFQCGTGTIAVAIALVHTGLLQPRSGRCAVVFEWGNLRVTPDPCGIRTSYVVLQVSGGRVEGASFSHSSVEIVAEGTVCLPER